MFRILNSVYLLEEACSKTGTKNDKAISRQFLGTKCKLKALLFLSLFCFFELELMNFVKI